MSGRVNKRLRRAARRIARNESGQVVAVNRVTGESRPVDLYKEYKKIHGRLTCHEKERHHPFESFPAAKTVS